MRSPDDCLQSIARHVQAVLGSPWVIRADAEPPTIDAHGVVEQIGPATTGSSPKWIDYAMTERVSLWPGMMPTADAAARRGFELVDELVLAVRGGAGEAFPWRLPWWSFAGPVPTREPDYMRGPPPPFSTSVIADGVDGRFVSVRAELRAEFGRELARPPEGPLVETVGADWRPRLPVPRARAAATHEAAQKLRRGG